MNLRYTLQISISHKINHIIIIAFLKRSRFLCNFVAVVLRQILLLPFALLYGLIVRIRNRMFDWGIIRQQSHPLPIISVGNLVAGGTGKTPHVEYLIRLLQDKYRIATLSRGYGRKSKGYRLAVNEDAYQDIGDEPMQYQRKFSNLLVAVSEDRNLGVSALLNLEDPPEVILLDDAMQHRRIRPGLQILLTDFHSLYVNDLLLPAGHLREAVSGAKRADIIVVTKTPEVFSPITRRRLMEELSPEPWQKLFFSSIAYDQAVPLTPSAHNINWSGINAAFLFAGIANPYPLEDHLRRQFTEVITLKYRDHHPYTPADIARIRKVFDDHLVRKKVLVTTEKDAVRLLSTNLLSLLGDVPLCYIPIRVRFHNEDGKDFDQMILDYVEQNRREPSLHPKPDPT